MFYMQSEYYMSSQIIVMSQFKIISANFWLYWSGEPYSYS